MKSLIAIILVDIGLLAAVLFLLKEAMRVVPMW